MITNTYKKIKNYARDEIPRPKELIAECEKIADRLATYPCYRFSDLYHAIPNRDNVIEYHRNNEVWGEKIGYNNWNRKFYNEDEVKAQQEKPRNEVRGIYIFYENKNAVYVGISRTILRRLKNHFIGKTHLEASLVYLMIRDEYDNTNERVYNGLRADLKEFQEHSKDLQEEMIKNWRIQIIPITENYLMHFAECYLASHLQTKWNNFETH